jgi:hypothetical protein
MQGIPFTVDPLQRLFQRFGRGFSYAVEGRLIEAGAVHLTAALHQIVRFVHQHRDSPVVGWARPNSRR